MAICRSCLDECQCTILGSQTVTVTGAGETLDPYVLLPHINTEDSPLTFDGTDLGFDTEELATTDPWPYVTDEEDGSPLWVNDDGLLVGKPDGAGFSGNFIQGEEGTLAIPVDQTDGNLSVAPSIIQFSVNGAEFDRSPLEYPGRSTYAACLFVEMTYGIDSGITTTGCSFTSQMVCELNSGGGGPGPVLVEGEHVTLLSGQESFSGRLGRFVFTWEADHIPDDLIDLTPSLTWNYGSASAGLDEIPIVVRWGVLLVPSQF